MESATSVPSVTGRFAGADDGRISVERCGIPRLGGRLRRPLARGDPLDQTLA
jgi:hypothetical protein